MSTESSNELESESSTEPDKQVRRRLTPMFRSVFEDIPTDESLVDVFTCAYQLDTLVQGKLYLTENFLCFHSNLVGFETVLILKFDDIVGVEKQRTALVIPNAIWISTANHQYTFTSFIAREQAFARLRELWHHRTTSVSVHSLAPPPVADEQGPSTPVLTIGSPVHEAEAETSCVSCAEHAAPEAEIADGPLERIVLGSKYPCRVDKLFWLLFDSGADFIATFWTHECGYSDVRVGEWEGNGIGLERVVEYSKPLRSAVGPSSATIQETQRITVNDTGKRYCVDCECRASGVPYSEAFYTACRYVLCHTPAASAQSMLTVSSAVVWTKPVLGMMKSMIIKAAHDGVEAQCRALDAALAAYLAEGPASTVTAQRTAEPVRAPPVARREVGITLALVAVVALAAMMLLLNARLGARIHALEASLARLKPDDRAALAHVGAACARQARAVHADLDEMKAAAKEIMQVVARVREQL